MQAPVVEVSEVRRRALLDAAVAVFSRFGFRKTSMDDVARAAGVSRQGLYLAFSNKEELFRRALDHILSSQLNAALAVLSKTDKSLSERLVAACDEWSGRFVGAFGGDAADLMCAGSSLAGDTMRHYADRFEQALAETLAASRISEACRSAGVGPAEVAQVLHATARGLKHTSITRDDFRRAIGAAVSMYCAPLSQSSKKRNT